MKRSEITPKIIREFLDHDPASGSLVWRSRARKWFKSDRAHSTWNARYAGQPAMTLKNPQGYLRGRIFGIAFQAHRVCWAHFYGVWPQHELDHISGVRDDNRIANLRDVTSAENSKNQRPNSKNTSGHPGVYWHARAGKWCAQIKYGGRTRHVGLYDHQSDAIAARKAAERKHGFHPNHGRAA